MTAEMLESVRRRRIVQILLLYVGVGWAILQVVGFFAQTYEWPRKIVDIVLFLLAVGFFITVVIGWYHGEKGAQRPPRFEIALLAALLTTGAIGSYLLAMRESTTSAAINEPRDTLELSSGSVAVLPFENHTQEPGLAWLNNGLAEMFTTDLAQVKELRVVSGQRVFDVARQAGRADMAGSNESATIVARRTGARYYVRGAVFGGTGDLRLDVHLIRVSDGNVQATATARGSDVFALVDSIATRLSAALLKNAPAQTAPLAQLVTANLDAYREYQQGLQADRNLRWEDAIRQYDKAIKLDSTFALAYARRGIARIQRGAILPALQDLVRAQNRMGSANERDRLLVQATVLTGQAKLAEAEATLKDLIAKYPDEKEAWMMLCFLYDQMPNRSADAERSNKQLIALDPYFAPAYNNYAYLLARRGDFVGADSLITRYVALLPSEPNPLDSQGEIRELAGNYDAARRSYLAALRVNPQFYASIEHIARSYLRQEQPAAARAALAPYTASPDGIVATRALVLTGDAWVWEGDFKRAEELYKRAMSRAQQAEFPDLRRQALQSLFSMRLITGRYVEALEALAPIDREDPNFFFPALAALGEMGRIDDMRRLREQVMEFSRRDPSLAPFMSGVPTAAQALILFYSRDYNGTLNEFATLRRTPRLRGQTGGYIQEILALLEARRGTEALAQVQSLEDAARRADRWDPVLLNSTIYLKARSLELLGRRAEAKALYEELIKRWGKAMPQMPHLKDVPQRAALLKV